MSRSPSSRSCACSTGAGAPVSGSPPLVVFGNAITSRIVLAPGEQRHDPVEPERDPAVRRRAVAQRVEQEAEPRLRLLLIEADQLEHLLLDLAAVDTDRAAADLVAVEHEVVGARQQRAGIVEVARRRRERVVLGVPALLVGCHANIGNSTTQRMS